MRNDSNISEVVERGDFPPSAKILRRAGPHDQKTLRAPVNTAPRVTTIYWHNELPPIDAQAMGEHTVEAFSGRAPSTLAHAEELWDQCYEDLMAQAQTRLEQEVKRLGGHYAHVLNEFVDSRHDGATGESWLCGRFNYVLYGQSAK